jgi:hypothetical protein
MKTERDIKMATERDIEHDIMKHIGKMFPNVRIFKNDTGMAFRGTSATAIVNGSKQTVIVNPKAIHYGLFKGSSDLIGWKIVRVTPDMVDDYIAAFVALEVKKPHGSHTSEEQRRFIKNVLASGGIAGIVTSPEDAEELLRGGLLR